MRFKRNKASLTDADKLAKEENFLASADKSSEEVEERKFDKKGNPIKFDCEYSEDPKAPRDYKLMTARFNKYEIGVLDKLSEEFGVNRMNVLRVAYINLAKEKGII